MHAFPVLTAVSQILKVFGWIVVAIGVLAGLVGLLFGGGVVAAFGGRFAGLLGGLLICINGLIVVAAGESIGVLFAIEANTRKAAS